MATVKVRAGRAWATVTGPASAELEAAVRGALGPAVEVLERNMQAIREDYIDGSWPVKSGQSRDAWHVVVKLDPGRMRADVTLDNPHEYVRYIKSTKVAGRNDAVRVRSPLQDLVRRPVADAKRLLAPELQRALADYLQHQVLRG